MEHIHRKRVEALEAFGWNTRKVRTEIEHYDKALQSQLALGSPTPQGEIDRMRMQASQLTAQIAAAPKGEDVEKLEIERYGLLEDAVKAEERNVELREKNLAAGRHAVRMRAQADGCGVKAARDCLASKARDTETLIQNRYHLYSFDPTQLPDAIADLVVKAEALERAFGPELKANFLGLLPDDTRRIVIAKRAKTTVAA